MSKRNAHRNRRPARKTANGLKLLWCRNCRLARSGIRGCPCTVCGDELRVRTDMDNHGNIVR